MSLEDISSENVESQQIGSLADIPDDNSERESHLTPASDTHQWTIFGLVTIQRQNRWIKITRVTAAIASRRACHRAPQLSHQTL
jgi:hypothetical protein